MRLPIWIISQEAAIVVVAILVDTKPIAISAQVLVEGAMVKISFWCPLEESHVAMHHPHHEVLLYPLKYRKADIPMGQQCAIFRGEGFVQGL